MATVDCPECGRSHDPSEHEVDTEQSNVVLNALGSVANDECSLPAFGGVMGGYGAAGVGALALGLAGWPVVAVGAAGAAIGGGISYLACDSEREARRAQDERNGVVTLVTKTSGPPRSDAPPNLPLLLVIAGMATRRP